MKPSCSTGWVKETPRKRTFIHCLLKICNSDWKSGENESTKERNNILRISIDETATQTAGVTTQHYLFEEIEIYCFVGRAEAPLYFTELRTERT